MMIILQCIQLSRTDTGSITEAESANIEFSIYTDETNGITTEGSASDIEIQLGITETLNKF